MSDYFDCKLCDKSIRIESKKKHLNSQYHTYLSDGIIFKYFFPNPDFLQMENIIQNYVLEYNKKFEFYTFICKWTLNFSDSIASVRSASVKSYPWRNISAGF